MDDVPGISFPESLPVSQRRDEIADAIRAHQVVIVAGETGSGKTTQLPKICLALGRGVDGLIGHTQPRRLAARTVADRIAHELGTELGGRVGYAVRFTDQVSKATQVKLMTDGILLAELRRDRNLRAYDTIIIDEAHERSLNIDFLLGYLARLLPKRPDLKVIVTSATIETDRFATHFGGAPVIEVSGRTFPVEMRYRPLDRGDEGETRDQITAIVDAVEELRREPEGDILVFLSGERDIRDTADALRAAKLRDTEILPLYARLSMAEQHRVFSSHGGRRIVLATNVAETSLTVPGIRFVVDPGTARISRYSHRLKVQRLPIEPVSQASANQRAGRCGRVADGICIRLYDEADFDARPAYTDPEILRTNLASVILQMTDIGLGDIASFPFLDPPDPRAITDGIRLLDELGALRHDDDVDDERDQPQAPSGTGRRSRRNRRGRRRPVAPAAGSVSTELVDAADGERTDGEHTDGERTEGARREGDQRENLDLDLDIGAGGRTRNQRRNSRGRGRAERNDGGLRLTGLGKRLARLPIEPRFGRMVLEADRQGCLREVLVIAAGLSIQDPRERPADHAQSADAHHARFADPGSDFLAYLNLWTYVWAKQRELSSSQFRKLCRKEHLNFLRIREWQDIHAQLRTVVLDLGLRPNGQQQDATPDQIHRALMAGLLSHLGHRHHETRDYVGARNARFAVFPGSALAKKPPDWVMAAELVETSRLWARTVARIDPTWAEDLGRHLLTHSYSEPHWSERKAGAMACERVSLFGLPIVVDRPVAFGSIDPEHARELFIRHALVEGRWHNRHRFIAQNKELLAELAELEHRFRRTDLVVDLDTLEHLYAERVPANVVSGRHFDRWWKQARKDQPDLLSFTADDLLKEEAADLDEDAFPATWPQGDLELGLSYAFEPGTAQDGVGVHIPLSLLNQVEPTGFDWQVPGLRTELLTELVRTLPKLVRRELVPVPDTVAEFLDRVPAGSEPLLPALAREMGRRAAQLVSVADFDVDALAPHLRMLFLVVDDDEEVLREGRDLAALKAELVGELRGALTRAAPELQATGLTTWTIGDLPKAVEILRNGQLVKAYPALADDGDTVSVRMLDTVDEQYAAHWDGVRRLLALEGGPTSAAAQRPLSNEQRLALGWSPYESVDALVADATVAALDALLTDAGGPPWTVAGYAKLAERARKEVAPTVTEALATVAAISASARVLDRHLDQLGRDDQPAGVALVRVAADIADQRAALVYDGFVAAVGLARLADIDRYVLGMRHRLERAPMDFARDRDLMAAIHRVQASYNRLLDAIPSYETPTDDVLGLAWMIEELRMSSFAQPLGVQGQVSEKRILNAILRAHP